MKNTLRVIAALYLLPGFIFDVLLGVSFILNDGRQDKHNGDFLGQWAIDTANKFPDVLDIPFMISVFVAIVPAAALCIGLFVGFIFLGAYLLNGVIGSLLQIPFTGRVRWITLTDLTD